MTDTSEMITGAGHNLELWWVNLTDIREQDRNARVMPPEMFNRLTENIKKENRLETVPLAVKRDNHFELISGHHRTRAARQAGIDRVICLVDTRDLSRSQTAAKQLAHNSIDGQDDPEIMKLIYDEIQNIEDMLESFIDPTELGKELEKKPYDLSSMELELPWKTFTLTVLPDQLDALTKLIDQIPDSTAGVGVVSPEIFQKFVATMIELGKTDNIKMCGSICARMVEITNKYLAEKAEKE